MNQPNRPSVEEVQKRMMNTGEAWPKPIRAKRPAARTHLGSSEIPPALRHCRKRAEAMRMYDLGLTPSQIAGRLSLPHSVVSEWAREVRWKEGFA